jgi:isopentenyldiphosphate isomerase
MDTIDKMHTESVRNKIEYDLIRGYFEKIKNSDAILIVNIEKKEIKGYIGGNSFLEMGFAFVLNKPIYLLHEISDVNYRDEIEAMSPIILNGDFSKISNNFIADNRELNIVDENGNIIGKETRENIHKQGLLHREVHVWVYTSKGEIIFQHRGEDKDTYPDLLDATVGGHVEIGSDYENSAFQELEEETGIKATKNHLILIQMMRSKSYDKKTNMTNNAIRAIYAYRYDGNIKDLRVEKGKAIGFEAWPFDKIFNIVDEDRKKFIPVILEEEFLNIFRKIRKL